MNKKTAPLLFILILIACFFLVWNLAGRGAVDVPEPAETGDIETEASETPEIEEPEEPEVEEPEAPEVSETDGIEWNYDEFPEDYTFRNNKYLTEHYEKHGIDMGFDSKESYEEAANEVIHHPDALHKLEAEDGDTCFFIEDTGEFVVLSTDGYIRTYFLAKKSYYDRQ